jgi:hypothetical protein
MFSPYNGGQSATENLQAIVMEYFTMKFLSVGFTILFTLAIATPQTHGGSCTPPPAGLVGWWPAEGNANDIIGGDNGTLQGGATFAAGKVGLGFRLDGTNGYVQIPDSDALKPTNVTVEAWVWLDPNLPSQNGGEQIVFKKNTWSAWFEGYSLLKSTIDNGNGTFSDRFQFCVSRYGNQVAINSQTIAQRGVWYHLAGTYDGNQSKLYVNGVLEASATPGFPLDYDTTPIFIGTSGTWAPYLSMFGGIIDEVSLYNRALSTNEIQAIYYAGSAGKCESTCTPAPAGLVSWWPAEGNANDIIGANNGMAQNISYINGEVGNAFYLNGSNADVKVPASSNLNVGTGNGFTFETWINPANLNPQPLAEWNGNAGDAGIGAHFWISEGKYFPGPAGCLYANLIDTGGGDHYFSTGGGVVGTNGYQHIALTYDQATGTAVIYWNGTVVQTSNLGAFIPQTSFDFYLGNRPSGSAAGSAFGGAMDEPSLYNRALSAAEIQAIYNAGSAGKCTPTQSGVPAISNFAPVSGTNGTVVIISGSNFSATASLNIVYFGAVQADVLSASPSSLTVTVPIGATYGPITIMVNGLTAYAARPFTPTFPGLGQIDNSSLASLVNLPTGNGPGQVVIADLDGDGRPDLIIPDSYAGEISIYQNISTNGSLTAGSFAPRVVLPMLPTSGTNPYRVVAADLDGDGRLDIIALNPDSNVVSILRNISSPGTITANSFAVRIDLPGGNVMRGLAVQDLNGDGRPEIVTGNNGDNTVSIFQNLSTVGNIAFAARVDFPAGNGASSVAIGDLDGDGQPDLAVANINDGTISVLRNTGIGGNISTNSFATKVDFPALATPFPIAIGDLDGDGKLDLVVGGNENSQAISVYRNTSTVGSITTNSFAPHVDFAAPGWVNSLALADLDGDGKIDIAVVSQLSSVFSIFKNVSTPGSFTSTSLAGRVDYPTGWNPNGVVIGDLNGDGRPDVVFANSYDNNIFIYQNQVLFLGPPLIVSEPTNQTVMLGGTAIFSVVAGNPTSSSYQWSFAGTSIPEATNSELTMQDVFPVNAGAYTVAITNVYGSVTSNPAMLKVLPPDITAPAILPSGEFEYSINTATGVNYEVEYSTNLINWNSVLTISGNGLPTTFIDPNTAGSSQRFYRIILSPQ